MSGKEMRCQGTTGHLWKERLKRWVLEDCTYMHVCVSECPPGFYGANCTEKCNCANNSTCNPKNGRCRCQPGWRGRQCDQS